MLGNNMFAYCGNNPVTCYDPSGNAYQGIYSQINYSEYEHTYGGHRENFYCLYDATRISITSDQVLGFICTASYTGGMSALPFMYPQLAVPIIVVGFYESYDKCRMSGLGTDTSFTIAAISGAVSNSPYEFISGDKHILADAGISLAAQELENVLIRHALEYVSPSERVQNTQTYSNNKNAGVSFGGGLRYMYTNYTGMRRDLIGNP